MVHGDCTVCVMKCVFDLGLVAWCSGHVFDLSSEVSVHRAWLVLRWVTACGQVNHVGM